MSELVIVIIGAVVIVGGVILYAVISTATGLEEDENQNYIPDIILQLRVTSPLRKVDDINKSLELFINNFDKYDSLRSVYELDKTPYKMYHIEKNNLLSNA